MLLAAAVAAVWLSAPAHAAETSAAAATESRDELPLEGVVSNPDWAQLPSADDVSRFYPPLANMMDLDGRVVIGCTVTAQGGLEACHVTSESPMGLGFGAAGLQMSSLFRMKPMSVDGSPVNGAAISVPISFKMDRGAPASSPNQPVAAPSARSVELGLRIVASEEDVNHVFRRSIDQLKAGIQGQPQNSEAKAALEAYEQAFEASLPAFEQSAARAYAQVYSEAELAGIATFLEAPAGKAWLRHSADLAPILQQNQRVVVGSIAAEARRRYCLKFACPGQPAPSTGPAVSTAK